MTWWKERLDQLRREDRQEQPTLQLPLPEGPPPAQPEDDEQERGTAEIDFTL